MLLEAEFCGYGSSSRNAGQLASAPGGDLQLLNLMYRKKMPGMVRLAGNAARFVEDLIDTYAIDCDYEPVGNCFAAVSRGQMGRVRRMAKILRGAGAHIELGTSAELGIPRGFVGGMREVVGGMMNPGKFSRGIRTVLLASPARVFEGTKVTDVTRNDGRVVLSTPQGAVRANKVVLATNAFAGEWIAITSSFLPLAGQVGDNTFHSIACNGHGLAQAPYVGSLIADMIIDGHRHDDLDHIWTRRSKFPPAVALGRPGLRLIWAVDRWNDLVNGSRRTARRANAA